ncbi:MAG: RdgB/HAM1 family non-canonical purine NTP pyrophosphatase [Methanomassiliicoccaceae archaeon]|jgi:XTP/dITP diphosphohydrolase|nr:RdgB/HAM1 family non-canonical purine NTP pyrophosphatase [Methanomassiliicoccaceae archaeon]
MILKVITSNTGKVIEYREALSSFSIGTEHIKIPYDEIQAAELREVVEHGMRFLRTAGVKDFVIDDSGLFVDALNGFPGVYSSYALKTIGNAGILKLMENAKERKANFQCCIGCNVNGKDIIVVGKCNGTILKKEQGTGGFGFDPIFSIDGERSFAEIPVPEKNKVSHRGNAVRLLMEELKNALGDAKY